MILPIVTYGENVLRKKCEDFAIEENLKELINNMYETMYNAEGVGLAAPQVDIDKRIFVIDTNGMSDNKEEKLKGVFINPKIELIEDEDDYEFLEGCLSIPGINENIIRPRDIKLTYYDENWQLKTESYTGLISRVIQHEYDHIEGVLFIDYLTPFQRKRLDKKLLQIKLKKHQTKYLTKT